jgi:hypothetical protein
MNFMMNMIPDIKNCQFISNGAYEGGGMLYCLSVPDEIGIVERCLFRDNIAEHNGGGIHNLDSQLVVRNCIFVSNNASFCGGGLHSLSAFPKIVNSTFTNNSAGYCGGGIHNEDSETTIINAILWDNTASEGNEIHNFDSTVSVTFSDILGGYNGNGNIGIDPLFVDSENGDFHLQGDSPCIDAGTPDTTGLNLPPYDFDGNERIFDGDGNGMAIVDMGAYEYDSTNVFVAYDWRIVSPEKYRLYQNYPNPFNPTTTINFDIPVGTYNYMSLRIYDITGELIKTLINGEKEPGYHSAIWNGRDETGKEVASGLYFYRLESENFMKTKPCLLVK